MPEIDFHFDADRHRWLQWHVKGLPEMRLFPTIHQRNGAVRRAGRGLWKRSPVRMVLAIAGSILLGALLFERCARFGAGLLAIPIGLAWIVLAWWFTCLMIRPAMSIGLREELNRIGVPVCLGCGAAIAARSDSATDHVEVCAACGEPVAPISRIL